ncbi:MAG: hypothetical protein AVDCRST_MAG56-3584 [uncultured Cytophagales bacterium]|uniref:Uncharacterized protein n=1 Tax=uncultured Cytophagales bacterium TaxID=158755 RepID=A0A6J4JGZ4_9SPHI|nr:MAG: hypothetical protein AVDCRST_MAG56-3584 [uncultured Cytophagales bacterium]
MNSRPGKQRGHRSGSRHGRTPRVGRKNFSLTIEQRPETGCRHFPNSFPPLCVSSTRTNYLS